MKLPRRKFLQVAVGAAALPAKQPRLAVAALVGMRAGISAYPITPWTEQHNAGWESMRGALSG